MSSDVAGRGRLPRRRAGGPRVVVRPLPARARR
ncbi:hypothetical protein BJ968_004064 [Kineococcus aurantiacus]|uniref:Uncharacterized protein n=1 Tax=Kineococcus aurantiacus TaxID=37633 RepID=A0A7Y9DPV3_9ACTN|nr:hypothetical protein [Kineococcus aurantiacus]